MKSAKPRINTRSLAPASVRPFSSPGRSKRGDTAAQTPTAERARNGQRAGLTDGRPLQARGQSAVRGRAEVEPSRTPAKSSLPHRANGAVPTPLIKVKAKARVGVQKLPASAQSVMKRPAVNPSKQEVAVQPEDESSVSSSSSSSPSSCNSISCIQRNEEDEMSASTSTWGLGTGSALNSRLRSMSGTSEWDCELQQMSLLEFEDVEEQWREERKAEEEHEHEGALTEDAFTAQNDPQVTPCPYPSRAPLDLTNQSEDDDEVEVDGNGFPSNVLSGTSAIEAGMSQSECHLEGSFSMRSSMPYEPSLSLNTNMMSHNGMHASIGMGIGMVLHAEDQDQVLFRTTKCSSSYNDSSSSSNSNSNSNGSSSNKNSSSSSAGEDSDGTNRVVGKAGSSECTDNWDLVSQVPGKMDLLSDALPTYERVWGADNDYDVDEEEVEEEEEEEEEEVSVQSSSTVSISSTANMIRNLRAAGVDQCLSPLDSVRSMDFSSCDLLPSRPIEHGGQCGREEWMRGREGEAEGEGEGERTETSPIEHSRPHSATDPSPSSSSSAMVDSSDLHKSIVVSLSCLLFCVPASLTLRMHPLCIIAVLSAVRLCFNVPHPCLFPYHETQSESELDRAFMHSRRGSVSERERDMESESELDRAFMRSRRGSVSEKENEMESDRESELDLISRVDGIDGIDRSYEADSISSRFPIGRRSDTFDSMMPTIFSTTASTSTSTSTTTSSSTFGSISSPMGNKFTVPLIAVHAPMHLALHDPYTCHVEGTQGTGSSTGGGHREGMDGTALPHSTNSAQSMDRSSDCRGDGDDSLREANESILSISPVSLTIPSLPGPEGAMSPTLPTQPLFSHHLQLGGVYVKGVSQRWDTEVKSAQQMTFHDTAQTPQEKVREEDRGDGNMTGDKKDDDSIIPETSRPKVRISKYPRSRPSGDPVEVHSMAGGGTRAGTGVGGGTGAGTVERAKVRSWGPAIDPLFSAPSSSSSSSSPRHLPSASHQSNSNNSTSMSITVSQKQSREERHPSRSPPPSYTASLCAPLSTTSTKDTAVTHDGPGRGLFCPLSPTPLLAPLTTPLPTLLPTPHPLFLKSLSDEPVNLAPIPSTSSFASVTQQPMSRSVVEFMQFEEEVRINEEKERESEGAGIKNGKV